ncbi:MAG: UPF0149 family protein [Gammaproteobacteria bacterium]
MPETAINQPDFEDLSQALQRIGALSETAEIHSSYSGSACIMGPGADAPWLAEVLADADTDNVFTQECADMLVLLAATTYASLEQGDMNFSPLLPADTAPLEDRTTSLALWCQGFLHGLAAAYGSRAEQLDKVVSAEILQDFSKITQAAFSSEETEEEGEAAYAELLEYVRVCVQLIFEETVGLRNQPGVQ